MATREQMEPGSKVTYTEHKVDRDDCTEIAREAYCGECGQIGCGHDGLERPEQRDGYVIGAVSVCHECLRDEERPENQTNHLPGEEYLCGRCSGVFVS